MEEKQAPPALLAAVIVAVALLGFFLYRAGQPPAATVPIPTGAQGGVNQRNPARPPVDEHANDWRPPAASR
jgi:hypothetical protein